MYILLSSFRLSINSKSTTINLNKIWKLISYLTDNRSSLHYNNQQVNIVYEKLFLYVKYEYILY
jgi:hypothetical protein